MSSTLECFGRPACNIVFYSIDIVISPLIPHFMLRGYSTLQAPSEQYDANPHKFYILGDKL